jgi:hypothetical protein
MTPLGLVPDLFAVTLFPLTSEGRFGISIEGSEVGIFIQRVDGASLVFPAGDLQPGDRVLAVNMTSTFAMSHAEAVSLFRVTTPLTLICLRYRERGYLRATTAAASGSLLWAAQRLRARRHRRATNLFDFLAHCVHIALLDAGRPDTNAPRREALDGDVQMDMLDDVPGAMSGGAAHLLDEFWDFEMG